VRAVALHPDGHTLASGGADRLVRLWDLRDAQILHTLFDHGYEIVALAFSAGGQVLASGSADPTVKLWDTRSGNALDSFRGHGEIVRSVHFSPNGRLLASSDANGLVRLWAIGEQRAAARGQVMRSLQGHTREVRAVVFSPDGRLLASGGADQVVQVWDVESGTIRHTFRGHTNTIKALAFRPDGWVLASGGSDRTIRLWPMGAGAAPPGHAERVLRGHTDEISSLAFSPDGRSLLSSSLDHTARIWAIDGGQETQVLAAPGCTLSGAVFSPDGQLAVTTAYNGTVHAWDVDSGQRLELWSGSDITALQVAFSPDGATLACVRSDLAIEIRDAATGAVLQMLRGYRGVFLSIAFSPTWPILVSSGWDGMIRIWDVETGACLEALRAPGPYAGMNIAGVTGISEAQKAALKALGAVDEVPLAAARPIEQLASHPAPSSPHNLPSPLTSFVGRADELARLAALLVGNTRLVTLIGPGGAGKTRLALAIAWQLLPQFADGVWWVALAGVQPADDPALQYTTLASTVATALGRTFSGRHDPLDELVGALHDRTLLLVLDNCEHLPEVAIVVRILLEAAPRVRVVATSREPLGLGGEALLRLEGLPAPPPGAADPASYPGVQLFLERAVQHTSGQVENISAGAVGRLCRLLDGLPLAIELAAHWVGYFTPDDIAEAIQADIDFLAARTRDVPDRHRSLRAVFDYAWRLLNATEQQALLRLSVFRGSFERAAAQAVADVRATTLVALVDKSLLQQAGVGRYTLHELLRQFAAERLGGDTAALRAQHAAYYLALAEQAAPELIQPDQAAALERLDRSLDNLRAALSWVWEQGQTELGLRLAGALERFWFTRGYLSEGREWLERFLAPEHGVEAPPAVRAQAFSAAGLLANTQGDRIMATRWLELGLACYRAADDLAGAVRALTTLGGVAYDQGDLHGAIERWEQSLAQARAVGDLGEVARALGNLGEAYYHLGDLARAEALHIEALALARQLGRTNLEAFQLGDLGNVARRQGDLERARVLHRQALELKRALGARRQIAITLEDLAGIAAGEGDGRRAASLLGAATAIREAIGTPQAAPERIAIEQAVAGVRAALGEEAWAAALVAGLALSLDQAISYALE
jgi:non-specific serine/threonine protein kinase